MKIMLDTQIYDRLADRPPLISALNSLQDRTELSVLSTQIQEDELAGMKDASKAYEVAKLSRERAHTAGGVYGTSKYDTGTYGDGSGSGISIEDVRSPSKRHSRDALIATSASMHADVLVTEDRRLANRLKRLSPRCQLWTFSKLEEWILAQMAE